MQSKSAHLISVDTGECSVVCDTGSSCEHIADHIAYLLIERLHTLLPPHLNTQLFTIKPSDWSVFAKLLAVSGTMSNLIDQKSKTFKFI